MIEPKMPIGTRTPHVNARRRLYCETVSATLELPVLDENGMPVLDENGEPKITIHPIDIALSYVTRRTGHDEAAIGRLYEIALGCPRRMDRLVHHGLQNLSIKISRAIQLRDPETGDQPKEHAL